MQTKISLLYTYFHHLRTKDNAIWPISPVFVFLAGARRFREARIAQSFLSFAHGPDVPLRFLKALSHVSLSDGFVVCNGKRVLLPPGWGGGYSSEFFVGVCRPLLQNLTLFQTTKTCHFPHPFSELAWPVPDFPTCFVVT